MGDFKRFSLMTNYYDKIVQHGVGSTKTSNSMPSGSSSDDDWDTDPSYENNVTDEQQRFGGNIENVQKLQEVLEEGIGDMNEIHQKAVQTEKQVSQQEYSQSQYKSYGVSSFKNNDYEDEYYEE